MRHPTDRKDGVGALNGTRMRRTKRNDGGGMNGMERAGNEPNGTNDDHGGMTRLWRAAAEQTERQVL
jgi:hypothetical protein